MDTSGTVGSCRRYPVKSFQGLEVDALELGAGGVLGDRCHALVELGGPHVLSAKRRAELLLAAADDERITLPGGVVVDLDDPGASERLSNWLDRPVELRSVGDLAASTEPAGLSYEMTFDPPDDDAEYYEIPVPEGGFVDLAPVHLVASSTLEGCRRARPDLDWDVRRFRPNLVLDGPWEAFVEDGWIGRRLRVGGAVLEVTGPTVRCAMPLRPQPAVGVSPALDRQPGLFHAMGELHEAFPNHLGAYASVVEAGTVCVGDRVELLGGEG